MSDAFTDIKIQALDDAASGPSGEGALLRMVLKLSRRAPNAWADYFNQAWKQHFYMMKRRASVTSDTLEVVCMPDELEGGLLNELQKVVATTNGAFKEALASRDVERKAEEERMRRQRQDLSDLKGRLKFD